MFESDRSAAVQSHRVLFSQLKPLAEARISVFTLSTFDTDYLLVKTQSLAATVNVLSLAGHRVLV